MNPPPFELETATRDAEDARLLRGILAHWTTLNAWPKTLGIICKVDHVGSFRNFVEARNSITAFVNHAERLISKETTPAPVVVSEEPLVYCAAARDGECSHAQCPQNRDGEPMKTGRHCPIDNMPEDD